MYNTRKNFNYKAYKIKTYYNHNYYWIDIYIP